MDIYFTPVFTKFVVHACIDIIQTMFLYGNKYIMRALAKCGL